MSQGASTSYYYWFDLLHPEDEPGLLELGLIQSYSVGLNFLSSQHS